MSVVLEFTVAADEFGLGRAVGGVPGMRIELERIVPTEHERIPFFWAIGGDFDALEANLLADENVVEFDALDRVGDRVLYRVRWTGDSLTTGIVDARGTILEGTGHVQWSFRVRFPDHQALADFYNYCTDHDVSIHVERVYTLTEDTSQKRAFDLTDEQREAIVLALQRGYFESPRDVNLDELADELGVSQQALSARIREANRKVLESVLRSSAEDLA